MKPGNNALITLTALWLFAVPLHAGALQDARDAFSKGDYQAAARAYDTALSSYGPSAGLYFNLGTALARDKKPAEAALNFRRAVILDPQLLDAQMALSEIERSQGVTDVRPSWLTELAERVPLAPLYVVAAAVFWIGLFWALRSAVNAGRGKWLSAGLLVVGLAIGVTAFLADPKAHAQRAGVVLAETTLLTDPADQSAAVTKLPPAAPVAILRRSGEWTFCETTAGERGWLPSKSVTEVVPRA